jgi:hypothetical protein
MKITKQQLRQIIKEELQALGEAAEEDPLAGEQRFRIFDDDGKVLGIVTATSGHSIDALEGSGGPPMDKFSLFRLINMHLNPTGSRIGWNRTAFN